MKIYTKTGDEGKTGLIGGTRVMKNDARIEAYGTVDELNSFVGLLASHDLPAEVKEFLHKIQHRLFVIGSHLATDIAKVPLHAASILKPQDIPDIEKEIDRMSGKLPELSAFILPGGSTEAGISHVCRTIARRAERRIVDVDVSDNQVLVYVNRLSDYFFVLSRYITITKGYEEILWKKEY